VTLAIRTVTDDIDLETLARLQQAVTPEDPTSLEELRWADTAYPGGTRFLAEMDGTAVGAATVGRIYVYPPEYPDLWMTLIVMPAARGRGVGAALFDAVAEVTRSAGKDGLQARCRTDRVDAVRFLERRGFVEFERSRMVRLELASVARPRVDPPPGISLTTLSARPDLLVGVHEVALESFPDIPGGDAMAVGELAEFRARDVDRPGIVPEAFRIAVDDATGDVVGYASLMLLPGRRDVAWHDMTAVRRAWRGRGIARTLKLATIAWALDAGLTALETGNDEENAPMRSVNVQLGYSDLPDEVIMRGPLPPGSESREDRA
jgi:mycothiol synthase